MNVSEQVIREIIKQALVEKLGAAAGENATLQTIPGDFVKKKAPSGVLVVKGDTVKTERFEVDGVALKDVTTLDESPNMGPGYMELDHAALEWTLTYDEYDIVLEGTLQIETDGHIVTGHPGDMIFIPKNTHIHFQTPDKVRYAYVTYPANWADLL